MSQRLLQFCTGRTTLTESKEFMLLFGKGSRKVQCLIHVTDKRLSRTIPVKGQHVNIRIARVASQIFLGRIDLISIIGIEDIMEAFATQIADGIAPQTCIFLIITTGASPPEEVAGMLMPGAEDKGYELPLIIAPAKEESGQSVKPCVKHRMIAAARKDTPYCIEVRG